MAYRWQLWPLWPSPSAPSCSRRGRCRPRVEGERSTVLGRDLPQAGVAGRNDRSGCRLDGGLGPRRSRSRPVGRGAVPDCDEPGDRPPRWGSGSPDSTWRAKRSVGPARHAGRHHVLPLWAGAGETGAPGLRVVGGLFGTAVLVGALAAFGTRMSGASKALLFGSAAGFRLRAPGRHHQDLRR